MKSVRLFKLLTAIALLGLAQSGVAAPKAKDRENAGQAKSSAVTRTTKEIGPDGQAVQRIVVTEDNGDGTITRITQVIHADGTTETRGERRPVAQKS